VVIDRGTIGKAPRETKGAVTVAIAPDAAVLPDAAVAAAPPDANPLSDATRQRAKDPRNHLQPEQGTLTVGAAVAKAGSAAIATVEVKAASGWHVSQEYTSKLWVEPAAGVTIEKTFYTAGGKHGRGDATTLTEQALAFSVKATPQAAGTYAVTGVLTFGICERDSCHPKTQAITIQVAAN
jgi:hypothetical protein